MWLDADSRQVEAVSIPARADGCIVAHLALVVPDQGVLKLLETLVVQLKELASDRPPPVGGPLAVLGVVKLVLALGVVQHREEADDAKVASASPCDDLQRIPLDASPVIRAVVAVGAERKIPGSKRPKPLEVDPLLG